MFIGMTAAGFKTGFLSALNETVYGLGDFSICSNIKISSCKMIKYGYN